MRNRKFTKITGESSTICIRVEEIEAIGFNMGNLVNEYLLGEKVDVVGSLEVNKFNGRESIQINLKDMRKSY